MPEFSVILKSFYVKSTKAAPIAPLLHKERKMVQVKFILERNTRK
jgi:hypothetical protein